VRVKFRYLILVSLIIFSNLSDGKGTQKDSTETNNWNFEWSSSYGFLLSHHPTMRPMSTNHFFLEEASISKIHQGNWANRFNRPRIGLSLFYTDMRSDILGEAVAVYPFIEFPLIRNKSWLSFKNGIGLGYLSKKYNAEGNWQNIAIGSHLNVIIALGLQFNIKLSESLTIKTGPALTHLSNGTTKLPNLGINLAQWKWALMWNKDRGFGKFDEPPSIQSKKNFRIGITWGMREIKPIGSEKYQVLGLFGQYAFKTRQKLLWVLGTDAHYNTATRERIYRRELRDFKDIENLRLGFSGGLALDFETWSFITQMGFYAIDKFRLDGNIYHRFGLMYDLNDQMGLNLTLKTHFARADHMEIGLFYKIHRK